MKLLTWNINGMRGNKAPRLKQIFESLDADIICLQETKVAREQLDESTAIVDGYNSYFSFSKVRAGYSGVATFVRDEATPWKAEDGLSGYTTDKTGHDIIGDYGNMKDFSEGELSSLDNEGRCIMTQHRFRNSENVEKDFVLINVYCPRAEIGNEERKTYKMCFYQLLQLRAEEILRSGRHVIIVGDLNTSHKKIDHCDPTNDEEFYANPGRIWLDNFLFDPNPDSSAASSRTEDQGHMFIDTFRIFYPNQMEAYTNWCSSTGARSTNYGCRLDYIFADKVLAEKIFSDCHIMPEIQGSDHCPVKAILSCSLVPAKKCPSVCTKYMPQFAGRQQKLSMFIVKKPTLSESDCDFSQSSLSNSQAVVESGGQTADESDLIDNDFKSIIQTNEIDTRQNYPSLLPSDIPLDSNFDEGFILQNPKRSISSSSKTMAKKSKTEPNITGKQTNLLNFFCKPTLQDASLNMKDKNETNDKTKSGRISSFCVDDRNKSMPFCGLELRSDGKEMNERHGSVDAATSFLSSAEAEGSATNQTSSAWKNLLKGPPQAPMCKGHNEPCVLRTVKKPGLNKGRQFWTCSKPEGKKTDSQARCDYFVWVSNKK